jgi:hypothetical protein
MDRTGLEPNGVSNKFDKELQNEPCKGGALSGAEKAVFRDFDADLKQRIAAASAPAVDLLGELFLVNSDISGLQAISAGASSPALYRAATTGYDLRPLRDDLLLDNPDNMIGGGLHVSIGMDGCLDLLAESAVAIECV